MSAETWWVVFNPYSSRPKIRHATFEAAQAEAIRLCQLTGKKIHVLALVGTAYPPKQPAAKWVDRRAT